MPSIFGRSVGRKDKHPIVPPKTSFQVKSGHKIVQSGRSVSAGYGGVDDFGNLQGGLSGNNGGPSEPIASGSKWQTRTLPARPSLPLTPPETPQSKARITAPETPVGPAPVLPPKYTFLPTRISPERSSVVSSGDDVNELRNYGLLGGVGSKVVLGVEDAAEAVEMVVKELSLRGLTTPMLFSNQALEINQSRTKVLIQNYLNSLSSLHTHRPSTSSSKRHESFIQDLRFANPHELAWFLRWSLSRITRIREATGEVSHGIIEWDVYEEWRGRERSGNYSHTSFQYLSNLLPGSIFTRILLPLFQLFARFAAHSHSTGLTPHTLSSLFSPLLFDIPINQPLEISHKEYIRAASATEHLLLSYIRSTTLKEIDNVGVTLLPKNLQEWVNGYPKMIISDAELAKPIPRKAAKIIPCEVLARNVRAYTKDLVMEGEEWIQELVDNEGWIPATRVIGMNKSHGYGYGYGGKRPKFSERYRKRMGNIQEIPALPISKEHSEIEYGQAKTSELLIPGDSSGGRGVRTSSGSGSGSGRREDDARFHSLAGKEWSMFEQGGFGSLDENPEKERGSKSVIDQRLKFDLTESAKQGIASKRLTMDWQDFASPGGGFTRTQPLLDVSLSLNNAPITNSINTWPKQSEDLRKKLYKVQKEGIPFNYDTSIQIEEGGGERKWLEDGFIDFWADVVIGMGWLEREELTFRDASWVIIEYKARPKLPEPNQRSTEDDRTTELCFIFEERVPLDYQLAIANPAQKRRFNLFSPRRSKRLQHPSPSDRSLVSSLTKSRSNLPGDNSLSKTPSRNTSAGTGAHSEFDRMLLQKTSTKRITLGKTEGGASIWHLAQPDSPAANSAASPTAKSFMSTSTSSNTIGPARKRSQSKSKNQLIPYNQGDVNTPTKRTTGFAASATSALRRMTDTPGSNSSPSTPTGAAEGAGAGTARERLTESRRRRNTKHNTDVQGPTEVDFEIHSASGISSRSSDRGNYLASPGGGGKEEEEEDKWMDILVANGAKRMDRQDVPPLSLPPVSPPSVIPQDSTGMEINLEKGKSKSRSPRPLPSSPKSSAKLAGVTANSPPNSGRSSSSPTKRDVKPVVIEHQNSYYTAKQETPSPTIVIPVKVEESINPYPTPETLRNRAPKSTSPSKDTTTVFDQEIQPKIEQVEIDPYVEMPRRLPSASASGISPPFQQEQSNSPKSKSYELGPPIPLEKPSLQSSSKTSTGSRSPRTKFKPGFGSRSASSSASASPSTNIAVSRDKPVPPIPQSPDMGVADTNKADQSGRYDDVPEDTQRSSLAYYDDSRTEEGGGAERSSPRILAPSPRQYRDTIHNIVDTYRDSGMMDDPLEYEVPSRERTPAEYTHGRSQRMEMEDDNDREEIIAFPSSEGTTWNSTGQNQASGKTSSRVALMVDQLERQNAAARRGSSGSIDSQGSDSGRPPIPAAKILGDKGKGKERAVSPAGSVPLEHYTPARQDPYAALEPLSIPSSGIPNTKNPEDRLSPTAPRSTSMGTHLSPPSDDRVTGVKEENSTPTQQADRSKFSVSPVRGLSPPAPIFDLTPGREPSPARYKHGEPLHFVGEEPEEEEDQEETF